MSSAHATIGTLVIAGRSLREAVKLYGLVLAHSSSLNKLGGEPCCVRVQLAANLYERGQHFKLWKAQNKIYTETFVSPHLVS